MRNILLLGGAAVFAVVGGVWTNSREGSSQCSDEFYVGRVHAEMRAELIEESEFLAALRDGAEAADVTAEDRTRYAEAAETLVAAINNAEVVGRAKHPSYKELKTCNLRLSVGNVLEDFDLGQSTFLGSATDREFEVVARFKINFETISGVEMQKRVDAQRADQFIVSVESEGDFVTSAYMAKLTRRAFDIHEPEFLEVNYNTSVEAPEGVELGYIGR